MVDYRGFLTPDLLIANSGKREVPAKKGGKEGEVCKSVSLCLSIFIFYSDNHRSRQEERGGAWGKRKKKSPQSLDFGTNLPYFIHYILLFRSNRKPASLKKGKRGGENRRKRKGRRRQRWPRRRHTLLFPVSETPGWWEREGGEMAKKGKREKRAKWLCAWRPAPIRSPSSRVCNATA